MQQKLFLHHDIILTSYKLSLDNRELMMRLCVDWKVYRITLRIYFTVRVYSNNVTMVYVNQYSKLDVHVVYVIGCSFEHTYI